MGTGSGCLAISLAKEYKNSLITATDISTSALEMAKKNSKRFNVCNQIIFKHCSWFETGKSFDIVVSNPPYLSDREYTNVSKEIKLYEPEIALRGGKDGFSCFREIAFKIHGIIHSESLCFLEIGYNQKNNCIKIFEEFDISCKDVILDYKNYERVLVFNKKLNNYWLIISRM